MMFSIKLDVINILFLAEASRNGKLKDKRALCCSFRRAALQSGSLARRRLARSEETKLRMKNSQVPSITYLRCAAAENTFVVAVGSIGKEVEEVVDGRVGAVLQLWFRGAKTRGTRMQNTELIMSCADASCLCRETPKHAWDTCTPGIEICLRSFGSGVKYCNSPPQF